VASEPVDLDKLERTLAASDEREYELACVESICALIAELRELRAEVEAMRPALAAVLAAWGTELPDDAARRALWDLELFDALSWLERVSEGPDRG